VRSCKNHNKTGKIFNIAFILNQKNITKSMKQIAKNKPCSCKSGKLYKRCCMLIEKEKLTSQQLIELEDQAMDDLEDEEYEFYDEFIPHFVSNPYVQESQNKKIK
jgi:hypothetical protein